MTCLTSSTKLEQLKLMINYLLRWYQEKALLFPFAYLVLGYTCVMKSVTYTVSVRNYFLLLSNNFKICVLIPSTLVSRDLPLYHSIAILNTHILYKQKLQICNFLSCCPKLEAYKKTKKFSHQRKQNAWKQFPSQLCVEANAAQIKCH